MTPYLRNLLPVVQVYVQWGGSVRARQQQEFSSLDRAQSLW